MKDSCLLAITLSDCTGQIITKCCCHLKVVKYDLSNFTQPWRSLPEDRESGLNNWMICQKESIGACVDNDSKYLPHVKIAQHVQI